MEKMKRIVVVAVMAVMSCMTAAGQESVYDGSTSLVDISNQWEGETLKGAADGTLIGMLDCFNKRWPTWMVTHALKTMRKGLKVERYGERLPSVFYDPKNGWVDVSSNAMNKEFMHVCYWRRTNGHRLLAIYLGKPVDPCLHFVCFYEYDPQKHILTPETHIIYGFKTTKDRKFYYNLPEEGKEMTISESSERGHFVHTFGWDGMKPVYQKTEEIVDFADGEHCDEDE